MKAQAAPRGVFVTGTDTEVGKTVASACLVCALNGDYWKPVQTGSETDSDSGEVARLTGLGQERFHAPAFTFKAPLSPHAAALEEGGAMALDDFRLPSTSRPLIVEGAGGLLVPLNGSDFMIDLMERLALPVVVVARSGLGTINHTLLTLRALEVRKMRVLGVIMVGAPNPSNEDAIRHFGRIQRIARIPPVEGLGPANLPRLPGAFTATLMALPS